MAGKFKDGYNRAQIDIKNGKVDYPGPGYSERFRDGYKFAMDEVSNKEE
jgi:hypothetical protein